MTGQKTGHMRSDADVRSIFYDSDRIGKNFKIRQHRLKPTANVSRVKSLYKCNNYCASGNTDMSYTCAFVCCEQSYIKKVRNVIKILNGGKFPVRCFGWKSGFKSRHKSTLQTSNASKSSKCIWECTATVLWQQRWDDSLQSSSMSITLRLLCGYNRRICVCMCVCIYTLMYVC